MTELELKPCPFCGTEVKMRKVPLYGYPGCFEFEVRCTKCGCTLDYTHADSLYRSEEEVALQVNKEIEKGAKVILMVPFLQTDHCGSHTAGYNVLFEKEEEE